MISVKAARHRSRHPTEFGFVGVFGSQARVEDRRLDAIQSLWDAMMLAFSGAPPVIAMTLMLDGNVLNVNSAKL
jgi:hypothetical protein